VAKSKSKKFDLVGLGIKTAALGAGAVGSKALDGLPVIKDQSTPIKAGAKILLGAGLSYFVKNELAQYAGYGAITMGGVQLAGHFLPSLGITGIPFEAPIALPVGSRVNGMPVEITGMAMAESEDGQGVAM
jgi:hypothetical protein